MVPLRFSSAAKAAALVVITLALRCHGVDELVCREPRALKPRDTARTMTPQGAVLMMSSAEPATR